MLMFKTFPIIKQNNYGKVRPMCTTEASFVKSREL